MCADIHSEQQLSLAPHGKERRRQSAPRRVYGAFRFLMISGLLLAAVAIVSVLLSVLNDPSTSGPVLLTLINANVLIILVFALYIGRHAMIVFLERRGRLRRSRLPLRFLGMFSILAVLPAMVVSIYAFYILNAGLETWFSSKVTSALEGSLQVAQAYLEENENSLLVEARALARDTNIADPTFLLDPLAMRDVLQHEQELRGLEDVSLYDNHGILMSSGSGATAVAPTDIATMLEETTFGAKALTNYEEQRITVLAPVNNGTWVLITKALHPSVLARVDQTEEAYKEYYGLLKDRQSIKLLFTLFLLVLALGTLAGAIWAGLKLAGKIVRPVTELVHATNKVSAGDLEVRLSPHDDDEMGILTQSFNRMTQQLKHNRTLVDKKNKELDSRRKTMEALLTGVSSGVVALDGNGIVTTANKIARETFDIAVGQRLDKVSPALAEAFEDFMSTPRELWQKQIRIERDGEAMTLLVRMVPQRSGGGDIHAVVVTFDDVSPLLSAQKVAAWSDVARRLAHEIKNPLTPIQLSAERLRRKYLDKIGEKDKELFGQLTSTIIRQTEDMRGMLNEFSDFARMPTPQFAEENILKILDEVLLLEKTGRTDISFVKDYQIDGKQGQIICDRSHLSRVFTNIVENAINAIYERDENKDAQGEVKIVVKMSQAGTLGVTVLDNGRGLPVDVGVDDLFDPYVTTRKKGTGLGLAIVRRVMDEHNGQVRLIRRAEGGTGVELLLPAIPEEEAGVLKEDTHAA
ncbi:MAG: ATP-binding protein [Alphaproteobacteria bacterium]|nr:ATP-binding protein [Alphaproteobacteria bacterium]